MPRVAALYRYPVKGFNPEVCNVLSILDHGRVAGDRVLGFRFADTEAPDDAWSRKVGMLALINTPGLAKLKVRFEPGINRLTLYNNKETLIRALLDDDGRQSVAKFVADYVLSLKENPLAGHPEKLPLRVVGDGVTPRYHDRETGEITLHSRESIAAVGDAAGDRELNELRFRSNIAIEGVDAWEEFDWVGHKLSIGAVEFDVVRPKPRCLATHANPETGERDLPMVATLVKLFGQTPPSFAVAMLPSKGSGDVHLGDEVRFIG
ncbi:MAG: MOSC domain-containing protein [Deltaproteobacteria bacterium]|nr:MOSC domain-containing protein [Deltaproteobacteria bacterium]